MNEAEVIRLVRAYFESLFPKVCPNCHRRYATLREYILATKRLGVVRSYDADAQDWGTTNPIGSVAQANCPCGTTLALSTEDMPLPQRLELLNWVKIETQRTGRKPSELLDYIRDVVRQQAVAEGSSPN